LLFYSLPKDKQKVALDVLYTIFIEEGNYTNKQRQASCERICLTLLRMVDKLALTEFFCNHIKEIMKIIKSDVNKVCSCSDNCFFIFLFSGEFRVPALLKDWLLSIVGSHVFAFAKCRR
jgi:hypothetical protein